MKILHMLETKEKKQLHLVASFAAFSCITWSSSLDGVCSVVVEFNKLKFHALIVFNLLRKMHILTYRFS